MSCDQYEAMYMFLNSPELLEKLLPYLDLGSTLSLAIAHKMIRRVLEGSLAWNKLLMRCSPLDQVEKVQDLTEILELLKEPKSKMLDLLDAICEQSFSSELWYSGSVRMGCPRHPDSPHLIPLERLEFLEVVEAAFDTTEQTVLSVKTTPFALAEPALSVLGDRLSWQQAKMAALSTAMVLIGTRKDAEDLKTILEATEEVRDTIHVVWITGRIGVEGWAALGQGVKSHPGRVLTFSAPKAVMEEAKREDLRVIWEALGEDGGWRVEEVHVEMINKAEGEEGWHKLEEILDMNKQELGAYIQKKLDDPNAWWKHPIAEDGTDDVEDVEAESGEQGGGGAEEEEELGGEEDREEFGDIRGGD